MHTTPEFTEAYRKLNRGQKQAVDAVEGPVMVVAGPGTGKTQVLTLRIANILLLTQTRPEQILALTYTESGAHAMKKRLAQIIGNAAYKVTISTFHGFANELILRYPEKFPAIIGGIPATEVEQIEMIKELLDAGVAKLLRLYGDPYYYVDEILRTVHTLKREGVAPTQFDALCALEKKTLKHLPDLYHEKGPHKGKMKGEYIKVGESLEKSLALSEMYHAYQKRLREMKRFDYEDMILETVTALEEDKDFLLILQEEYQYILADEHQDTNNAQNRILELLSSFHPTPNLFIVGDEKQAIYRFQGASLSNFLYFQEKYPDVLLIELIENYRSTQTILDSAHALIMEGATANEVKLRVPLIAKGGSREAPILVAHLPSPRAELLFIAEDIERRRKAGEQLEDIAVLARKNSDIRELALVLSKRNIPYHMLSEADILQDEEVGGLLRLFRAVVYFGDDATLILALENNFWGLDHLDIWNIVHVANREKRSVHEILRNPKILAASGVGDPERLSQVYSQIHLWHKGAKNRHVLPLVEEMIRESGLLTELLRKPEGSASLRAVDRLYDELQSLASRDTAYTLQKFLTHIDTLSFHRKGLETSATEERPGVRLMSAHKAKGLEFDHIYILNASAKAWEGRTRRTSFQMHLVKSPLEDVSDGSDERRLFYVALTRARKSGTITYAEMDQNGKPSTPSRFISDIHPTLLRHDAPQIATVGKERYEKRVHLEPRLLDLDFIRARFCEQGLSVTGLNNFLECPWQYIHRTLLRIPSAKSKFLSYGSAIDSALRTFFDVWKDGGDMGEEKLIERFYWLLDRQPLLQADEMELRKKGERALRGFYMEGKGTWPRNIKNQYSLSGVGFVIEGEGKEIEVIIKGTMDKLEIGEGGRVRVIDYKTGKVKSRNALLGKTKEEDTSYLRQLTFYKLLLQRFDTERYVMESGTIEFVEPNERGKYVRETFEITDEEVKKLEEEAKQAATAIYNLSFWGKRCEKEECEFCDLYAPLAEKSGTDYNSVTHF